MESLSFSQLLICSILILSVCQDGVEAQSLPCTLPTKKPGQCVPIQRCQNIYNIVTHPTPQNRKYDAYIKKAACSLPGVARSICCELGEVRKERFTTTTSTTITARRARTCNIHDLPQKCGRSTFNRIANGNETKVFEYPWMALLQYNVYGNIEARCGGSLINARYVLTAGHCIKTKSFMQLHSVILGEHTKNQMVDCIIYRDNNGKELERDCAEPIEEFGIESFQIHPDYYKPKYSNDIGLIRLDRDVIMKEHIQPICLPITRELQTQEFPNYIVTGWGATENASGSDVLMQATLMHVERAKCQQQLTRLRTNIQLSDKHMCAKGKGLADSCSGDSGGPLIFSANYPSGVRFVQLGIVATGIRFCGHKSAPGVYSQVASYMDWILGHMECGA